MITAKKIRAHLWVLDPGFFQLRLAVKTVLAIIISLWLVHDRPILTILVAGVVSGFSMQGVVAKTWQTRLLHVLTFDFAYCAAFILGLMVRDSGNWIAITLVGLGFIVNYIRRFQLENSAAPMHIWTLCFLATIIPFPHNHEAWVHLYGLFVGLTVSSLVTLLIFPENYSLLFINNSNQLLQLLAQGMKEVRQYLLGRDVQIKDFAHMPFMNTKMSLVQLVDSNQILQQNPVFASKEKQIDLIVTHQYAVLNAYSLMLDAYQMLWSCKQQLPRSVRLALSQTSKKLTQVLLTAKMRTDYQIDAPSEQCVLPNLANQLGQMRLADPTIVIALLNLKLSFDILNQHLTTWLWNRDEA